MQTPFLQFDFPRPLCFADPVRVIMAENLAEVLPALQKVQKAVESGLFAAGFVSYEAAPAFDSALSVKEPIPGLPLLWFGLFDSPTVGPGDVKAGTGHPLQWFPEISLDDYRKSIDSHRMAIAAGEVYQVNHTFRMKAFGCSDSSEFYNQLAPHTSANYCAFLDLGRFQILSLSPELFFHRAGTTLITRPMKGTRPRGRWGEEDAKIVEELAGSEKDRAENVMIVDLLRNDLGRVAVPGSVQVTRLFEIEQYPTLWQMTSKVEAQIPQELGIAEIFTALFPCGSVTGAPKVSAMKRIAGWETSPRGPYCGAVGYILPGGGAMFNVAIRTALHDTQTGELSYGVGGGIVWDSTADEEYAEALSKAAVLSCVTPSFELLETLRWEEGKYALHERHLERLISSAAYFGIMIHPLAVERALEEAAELWDGEARRVRLLVSLDGAPRVEAALLKPLPKYPINVGLARTPVSRHDPFLCHKTTHRRVYDEHRRESPHTFDVLLWNEEGELTEFTIGNLVAEHEGILWTPPRECGLLNGTFRAELISQGRIRERVLRREDLQMATGLWLINSVRGFVPVTLSESESDSL